MSNKKANNDDKKNKVENNETNIDNEEYEEPQKPLYYAPIISAEKLIAIVMAVIIIGMILLIGIKYSLSGKTNTSPSVSDSSDDGTKAQNSETVKIEKNDVVVSAITSYSIFGDEYVSGQSQINSFSNMLSQLLGGNVYDVSCPYENMIQISARQGGFPAIVQPFTIPADTVSVEIELKDAFSNPITFSFDKNGGLNPCTINSIEGEINMVGDKFTFTRRKAGKETAVSLPTPVYTKAMHDKRSDRLIIFAGNEDLSDTDKLVSCYKQMVDFTSPLQKSYVIVGVVNGSDSENAVYDKKMTEEFSRHYVNVREYLSKYGLSDANSEPTETDKSYMEVGRVPESFYNEDGTLTQTANNLIAQLVYERMKELSMI